ncbi:hypothetical protein VDG1235_207, partial [Verrucomicrobiia bacterium DG1235]
DRAAVSARVTEVVAQPEFKRVPLNTARLAGDLKDWKVTDLKGRDLKGELAPALDDGKLTVVAGELKQFALKPQTIETRVLDAAQVMELPGGIVMRESGSSGVVSEALDWFKLTILASPLPASWNPSTERYSTKVTLGIKSPPGSGNPPLDEPVQVRVAFEGLEGDEPPPLAIEGAGLSAEKSFMLNFRPTTGEPKLLVRSSIVDIDLKLKAVSRLALRALRQEVLGFGLERVAFSVSEVQPHGQVVENQGRIPVSVTVSGRGRVEPEQPVFEEGEAVTQFNVRSSGLGEMEVQARVGDSVAVATVVQRFPTGPLLAVLIGGALGGYARRFVKGAPTVKLGRWVVEGLVVSVIAFVAGVLGVGNLGLPSAIVATEAGAFLTGAFAGFVGVVVLEKLTAAFGRK